MQQRGGVHGTRHSGTRHSGERGTGTGGLQPGEGSKGLARGRQWAGGTSVGRGARDRQGAQGAGPATGGARLRRGLCPAQRGARDRNGTQEARAEAVADRAARQAGRPTASGPARHDARAHIHLRSTHQQACPHPIYRQVLPHLQPGQADQQEPGSLPQAASQV